MIMVLPGKFFFFFFYQSFKQDNCGFGKDSRDYLDCKEIKPVNPKGNQSRIFIGRTDAEAETPILWPRDVKN